MTGKKSTTTTPELATRVASSEPQTVEALRETFNELDVSANEKAKGVAHASAASGTAWDKLLPVLSEMQSLLSQRGRNRDLFRDAELPTWTEWWETFKKEKGLPDTLHTVQVHLSKYRSMDKATDSPQTKRPTPPRQFSKVDRERLLEAAQYGNELVTALDNHADYTEPLREFKRVAMGSDRIGRLLEDQGSDRGVRILTDTPTAPATATAAATVSAPPVPIEQVALPPKPLPMPKAGDCSGLFNFVNDTCGGQITATFKGLSPDLMADVFGEFVTKLAQAHCHFDREAGEISVTVQYVSAKRPALGNAA